MTIFASLAVAGLLSRDRQTFLRRTRDEYGASAVEYGLLIAGVAAVITLAVFAFGGSVTGLFQDTCDQVASTTSTATC